MTKLFLYDTNLEPNYQKLKLNQFSFSHFSNLPRSTSNVFTSYQTQPPRGSQFSPPVLSSAKQANKSDTFRNQSRARSILLPTTEQTYSRDQLRPGGLISLFTVTDLTPFGRRETHGRHLVLPTSHAGTMSGHWALLKTVPSCF